MSWVYSPALFPIHCHLGMRIQGCRNHFGPRAEADLQAACVQRESSGACFIQTVCMFGAATMGTIDANTYYAWCRFFWISDCTFQGIILGVSFRFPFDSWLPADGTERGWLGNVVSRPHAWMAPWTFTIIGQPVIELLHWFWSLGPRHWTRCGWQ